MSQMLYSRVEWIKSSLEKRFLTRLVPRSESTACYPDLFELWTLFNVIDALADSEPCAVYTPSSRMGQGVASLVPGDVHPVGRCHGATIERIGLGMAPTITVSSGKSRVSVWYDKYTGATSDGKYWPRPDIVIRRGGYEVLKSIDLETSAKGIRYRGGFDIKRGWKYSETTRGWRSLTEILRGDPRLSSLSNELVSNFQVTKTLLSVISEDTGQVEAAAGHPFEELPSDDRNYLYGEVQGDDSKIFWARKKSFVKPSKIIECKSGLLTPHAIEQLLSYREIFSSSQLLLATTRIPDTDVARKLQENNIQIIEPPATMEEQYSEVIKLKLEEGA